MSFPPVDNALARQQLAFSQVDVPSLRTMHDRYVIALGTCYEEWARDALITSMAYHQAVSLDMLARQAMTDPKTAMDTIRDVLKHPHKSLSYLDVTVFCEAAKNAMAIRKREKRVAKKKAKVAA